jgi:hypothetical protein
MRKFFNGLVMGILLSAAAFFFLGKIYLQQSEARLQHEAATRVATIEATNTADPRHLKLDLLELRDEEIKAELKKSSEIIRKKPRDIGENAAGPDSDTNVMAEIKQKYQTDPKLSVCDISVNCAHGHVALIGTVPSLDSIGQAIVIALESGGVRDVTSTLQVKAATDDAQTINP